ncbi:MAG: sugar transferase [Fusobacterium sp.]|nr:sugar transferase [Fusobacterium sp.]
MYKKYFKRILDFLSSFIALIILFPLILILSVIGMVMMKGNPFFFQPRPGKDEKVFNLIKFRTMSNAKDKNGNLLPDEIRLNSYGKFLRSTSLDELPSLINILYGNLAIVGPRPQLVRDMVFMSDEQRKRHSVRPGLTGLAQVNGRNNITWEQKFEYDLSYIEKISFFEDLKIIFKTFEKVVKRADVVREGTVSDMDFGDWLLSKNRVTKEEYEKKQEEARKILKKG